MANFKLSEQYHFGKLEQGTSINFVRTPKPQVYSGKDLKKRKIRTFDQFYEANPCGFKEGDNISICIKNDHGGLEELSTKTILPPVKNDDYSKGLADGEIPPLHSINNQHGNTDLVKSYKDQITILREEKAALQERVNSLGQTTIDQSRELAEKEVEMNDLKTRLNTAEEKYDELWKEFGDLIKEARKAENSTPSLGDRLGTLLSDPEVMDVVKAGAIGLAGYIREKVGNTQTRTLNDGPPTHNEVSEDPAEVFDNE